MIGPCHGTAPCRSERCRSPLTCLPLGLAPSCAQDDSIADWVKLACNRARATGAQTIFWLDENRAHDAQLIQKVGHLTLSLLSTLYPPSPPLHLLAVQLI